MKKKFPNNPWIIDWGFRLLIFLSGAMGVGSSFVWASSDLDRQFKLETIGFIKSRDNIDGLFADFVSTAYKDYFLHQSRFVLNDLAKADMLISESKLSYSKVIHDPAILGQIARSTRTESIIRTEIIKEGSRYFFTLDWLHSPQMEIIASERFEIQEAKDGTPFGSDSISETIQTHLNSLVSKLPFVGHVTGRDNNSVTINIGSTGNIKKGDILVVSTLDEVKKHPLLKAIVDWRLSPTGKLLVEQTEDGMAFCKVLEEESGKEISRYQKITQIQTYAPPQPIQVMSEQQEDKKALEEPPHLGFVGGTLPLGVYSRQMSTANSSGTTSNSGGGIDFGIKAEGQLWFTKNWFADLGFGYDFWNFSQHDNATNIDTPATLNGGISGSSFSFKMDVGYSYLVTGEFSGPKGWVKFGYKSQSYSLPLSPIELTGTFSIRSVFLGLGGDWPIREGWGAITNVDFRLFSSASLDWAGDTVSGTSDVEFFIGGYYRLTPRLLIRGGLNIVANGADLSSGGSLSQKTVTIAPALLYYF